MAHKGIISSNFYWKITDDCLLNDNSLRFVVTDLMIRLLFLTTYYRARDILLLKIIYIYILNHKYRLTMKDEYSLRRRETKTK